MPSEEKASVLAHELVLERYPDDWLEVAKIWFEALADTMRCRVASGTEDACMIDASQREMRVRFVMVSQNQKA